MDTKHELVGVMGPFGSGKTSACPIKGHYLTQLQVPMLSDGVRRSKGYVIRDTYRNLWDKTIPSWKDVFPDCKGWPFKGAKGGPATHVISWVQPNGDRCEMIVEFRAIGDQSYEEFAKGLYATWIWLNEGDSTPEAAIGPLLGRLGRYPQPHEIPEGAAKAPVALMFDFNAPLHTNWTVKRCMVNPKPLDRVYVQPSGFSPDAENMDALRKIRPDYYEHMALGMQDWEIARFIKNMPGYSRSGKPVYTDYARDLHVLEIGRPPRRGARIIFGGDAGSTPAGVFLELMPNGSLHPFAELVTEPGELDEADSFGKRCAATAAQLAPGSPVVAALDPSSWAHQSGVKGGISWALTFAKHSGFALWRPPTNDPLIRIAAVKYYLTHTAEGRALLQMNPEGLDTIIEGFVTGYKIKKLMGHDGEYHDKPDKGHFSHVHDGFQYGCMLARAGHEVMDQVILNQAAIIRAVQQQHSSHSGDDALAHHLDYG